MSERERWIVYPLLFLALGAALRDKIAKQTQTKEIVCERLFLVDSEGRSVGALIGDDSQLSATDRALLNNMRRASSRLAIGSTLSNVVDAESIVLLNQPLRPPSGGGGGGGGATFRSLGEMLQYLQRLGVLQVAPRRPELAPAPAPSTPPAQPSPPLEPPAAEATEPPTPEGATAPPSEPAA
ncbi:MAG: hypothetical protein AAFV43_15885 [Planctomycetota bacterium]